MNGKRGGGGGGEVTATVTVEEEEVVEDDKQKETGEEETEEDAGTDELVDTAPVASRRVAMSLRATCLRFAGAALRVGS